MKGEVSRKRMKRVSAWMSTVNPMIRKLNGTRTIAVSTAGGAAAALGSGFLAFAAGLAPAGGAGGAAAGDTTSDACATAVSQVYGGTTLLISSMMCVHTKRSSSIARMMLTCRSTEPRWASALRFSATMGA